MPELPEVEIMARLTRGWAAGKVIRSLDLLDPSVLVAGGVEPDVLVGGRVTSVRRRAKHLIIETPQGDIAVHSRMTGKLVSGSGTGRERFTLALDDGTVVSLRDTRRLAELRVLGPGGAQRWLDTLNLGPDAWPDAGGARWWRERFAGARGPIKPALLDQRRVAGIGNILASELLWRARIAPERPVPALVDREWQRIADAIGPLIDEVIAAESGAEIAYVNEGGSNQAFAVYGRDGSPCRRCGAPIRRRVQGGRSSYCCDGCQR